MGPFHAFEHLVVASRCYLGRRSHRWRLRSLVSLDGSLADTLELVDTALQQLEGWTSLLSWPGLLDSTRMVFYGAAVKLSKIN